MLLVVHILLCVSSSTRLAYAFYPFCESFLLIFLSFVLLFFVLLCVRLPHVARVPGGAHFSGVVVKSFLHWLKWYIVEVDTMCKRYFAI